MEVKHSLFTDRSIQQLLDFYDIGTIIGCHFLTRGLNDSYLVMTKNRKYIFRIYRKGWREESDILFEVDALNHLSESGVPVSAPIKRIDGNWMTVISAPEGMRHGVLFTFTHGERPEIHESNCYLIGRALGNIHKVTESFQSTNKRSFELNINHLLDEPMSLITPTLHHFMGVRNDSFFNELVNQLKADIIEKTLEYGFCHGDFHNYNMHLIDQKIEAFDFDCCGFGYRAYDMSVFWWNLKQNYPSLEESCWDEFLNGYHTQTSIGEATFKILLKFVTIRRIWFLGILLKNDDVWGTNWINEKNLDHFISQLEQDAARF